jgi:hypothetical protein
MDGGAEGDHDHRDLEPLERDTQEREDESGPVKAGSSSPAVSS